MTEGNHSRTCEMGCRNADCVLAICRECGEDWPCEGTRQSIPLTEEAKAEYAKRLRALRG